MSTTPETPAMQTPPSAENTAMTPQPQTEEKKQLDPANPQDLFTLLGKIGMQAEQKEFGDKFTALLNASEEQKASVVQQEEALKKKSVLNLILSAAGAAVGAVAMYFGIARNQEKWSKGWKTTATVGGGLGLGGIVALFTGSLFKKQVTEANEQKQAAEEKLSQEGQALVDEYGQKFMAAYQQRMQQMQAQQLEQLKAMAAQQPDPLQQTPSPGASAAPATSAVPPTPAGITSPAPKDAAKPEMPPEQVLTALGIGGGQHNSAPAQQPPNTTLQTPSAQQAAPPMQTVGA